MKSVQKPTMMSVKHLIRISVAVAAVCAAPALLAQGGVAYVAPDGEDGPGRGSSNAPYATIQVAIDAVAPDGTVYLMAGTYEPQGMTGLLINLTNAVNVIGAGRDQTIITAKKSSGLRFALLTGANAKLSGVTFADGSGSTEYVSVKHMTAEFTDSRVTRCSGKCAVFIPKGIVRRCVMDSNSVGGWGTSAVNINGSWDGTYGICEDSLIVSNQTTAKNSEGGGVYVNYGILRNCTVADNYTVNTGGGVRRVDNARVQNCVIVNNSAPKDTGPGSPNWSSKNDDVSRFSYCATPQACGATTITNGFAFVAVGDYRLTASSTCVDAGPETTVAAERLDLDGGERISGSSIDIGCYEFDQSAVACSGVAVPDKAFKGATVEFTASVMGFPEGAELQYAWTLTPENGDPVSFTGGPAVSRSFTTCGLYSMTLTVTDDASHSATYTNADALYVAARTNFVTAAQDTTPVFPYDTPETAARCAFDVLDITIDGSVVAFLDGDHVIPNELAIEKPILVISLNGRDRTSLHVAATNRASRVLSMNHAGARVEGLTIYGCRHNGFSKTFGAGVKINPHGGTLADCVVSNNLIGYAFGVISAAGVYVTSANGRVTRCIIVDNGSDGDTMSAPGVWVEDGQVDNCLIARNVGKGNGDFQNSAALYATGAAKLYNNTIVCNTNLVGNYAAGVGIKSDAAYEFRNNIVYGNYAPNSTGSGSNEWCQILQSAAAYQAATNGVSHNCFGQAVPWGTNYVAALPGLVDLTAGDFRLDKHSPCRDVGLYRAAWHADQLDLLGNPRVVRGKRVDLGAYEYNVRSGTVMFLR
ncbi:MAG: choice-of-anchor Q domain-containing protein [Kiritimatiellia bacterium]